VKEMTKLKWENKIVCKNRQRDKYSFANINLLGQCNADCYFCLGKDIPQYLQNQNQLRVHFSQWVNFYKFLNMCQAEGVRKLYLTGQTADGLQYAHLEEIVDYLQGERGFLVGVRTNGYLAKRRMSIIKKMQEEIGYSIHSLNPEVNNKIMGIKKIPDWKNIIPESGKKVRVSIVLNRYNVKEIYDICAFISQFPNVNYIQIRRVSTDTRETELRKDIELFEDFYKGFASKNKLRGKFCLAPKYELFGKEILFWRTVETSVNSLNYFTDGTCSDEYFIIEGYLKYCQ